MIQRNVKEPELLTPTVIPVENKPLTIMVIPDSHAEPHWIEDDWGQRYLEDINITNQRYDWAGRMIVDMKPDLVVELGDFCEMESFSDYRDHPSDYQVKNDYRFSRDARQRLTNPLRKLQGRQRKRKQKIYRPELIALQGNHEYRVNRFEDKHPDLKGEYSDDPSGARDFGWKYFAYRRPVCINGVWFCHNFPNPISRGNLPISGQYAAHHIIHKLGISGVGGHAHDYKFAIYRNGMSGVKVALIAGCYFEQWHKFAGPDNYSYERGITMLYNVQDAFFTHRFYTMDEIRHAYSGKF